MTENLISSVSLVAASVNVDFSPFNEKGCRIMARPPFSLTTSINKVYFPFLSDAFSSFSAKNERGYLPAILVAEVIPSTSSASFLPTFLHHRRISFSHLACSRQSKSVRTGFPCEFSIQLAT